MWCFRVLISISCLQQTDTCLHFQIHLSPGNLKIISQGCFVYVLSTTSRFTKMANVQTIQMCSLGGRLRKCTFFYKAMLCKSWNSLDVASERSKQI